MIFVCLATLVSNLRLLVCKDSTIELNSKNTKPKFLLKKTNYAEIIRSILRKFAENNAASNLYVSLCCTFK